MSVDKPFSMATIRVVGLVVGASLLIAGYSRISNLVYTNWIAMQTARLILAPDEENSASSEGSPDRPENRSPGRVFSLPNPLNAIQAQHAYLSAYQALARGEPENAGGVFAQLTDCSLTTRCKFAALMLGELLAQSGYFEQAHLAWQPLSAAEYFSARGESALAARQLELSLLYFESAARSFQGDRSSHMGSTLAARLTSSLDRLGVSLLEQDDFQKSSLSFQLCTQFFPTFVPCRLHAAQVYMASGQPDLAQAGLQQGIQAVDHRANPEGAALLYLELARIQSTAPDPTAALNTLLTAQSAGIQDGELAIQLGIYLRESGQMEQAVQQFLFAGQTQEAGLKTKASRQLAYTYIQLEELEQAARIFHSLVESEEARADDMLTLARLSLRLGNLEEACIYYQRALAESSTLEDASTTSSELQAKCPETP